MCDMENFCKTLEGHVAILSAMVVHKKKFHRLLAGDHHEFGRYLELVEISDWAGLGGVRYIPEAWATTPASVDQLKGKREAANSTISKTVPMSESDRDLINQVNQQLVARLRASDSAFSLGELHASCAVSQFSLHLRAMIRHLCAIRRNCYMVEIVYLLQ